MLFGVDLAHSSVKELAGVLPALGILHLVLELLDFLNGQVVQTRHRKPRVHHFHEANPILFVSLHRGVLIELELARFELVIQQAYTLKAVFRGFEADDKSEEHNVYEGRADFELLDVVVILEVENAATLLLYAFYFEE